MAVDGPNGLVNIFKPQWIRSTVCVYRLRKLLQTKKIGHAGTLDPFADGVLLAGVGKGTKLVERLMGLQKVYDVGLTLGVTNVGFDIELPLDPVEGALPPEESHVRNTLAGYVGVIEQIPPNLSAIKVDGVRSHQRVRDGETVVLKSRPVRIDAIELHSYEWPKLQVTVTCGRGTYIRALARDWGAAWGCGAVCHSLTRSAIGPFRVADSIALKEATPEEAAAALLSIDDVMARIEAYEATQRIVSQ